MKHFRLSILYSYLYILLFAQYTVAMQVPAKPKSLPFLVPSPKSPLFIISGSVGYSGFDPVLWNQIPESVRRYFAAETCAGDNTEKDLLTAQKYNIPVVLRVRSVYPKDYRKPIDFTTIEKWVNDYPCIRAISVSELMNSGFTKEERDYLITLIEICCKKRKLLIWTECLGGSEPWLEVGIDEKLYEAIRKNPDCVIPVFEVVEPTLSLVSYSAVVGLYISGTVNNWGINPQKWYWQNSGFRHIGQCLGYQKGERELMPPAAYVQIMMMAAMDGATVYFLGGEAPPHIFQKDRQLTKLWNQAVLPIVKTLIEDDVIADRPTIDSSIKVAVWNKGKNLFEWSDKNPCFGKYSIEIKSGLAQNGWSTENWMPVNQEDSYLLRGRVFLKQIGQEAKIGASVYWYDKKSKGWPFISENTVYVNKNISGEWQSFEMSVKPHFKATNAVINLFVADPTMQTVVNFDDIEFIDLNSQKNLLQNGSFEKGNYRRGEPEGWTTGFSKREPQLESYGKIGQFYCMVYGKQPFWKLFTETARWGVIPILPGLWMPEDGTLKNATIIPLASWDAAKIQKKLDAVPNNGCQGMRAQYPAVLWLAGSNENSKDKQKSSGRIDSFTINTNMASSQQILVKQKNASNFLVLAVGRENQTLKIMIQSKTPFILQNGSQIIHSKMVENMNVIDYQIIFTKGLVQKFYLVR